MLFIIEVTQHKHAVLNNNPNIRKEYEHIAGLVLKNQNISGLEVSPMANGVRNDDTVTVEMIVSDLVILYKKYILKYVNDHEDSVDFNLLYLTFLSSKQKKKIQQQLKSSTHDYGILYVFDELVFETSNILQLLYREFVFENVMS